MIQCQNCGQVNTQTSNFCRFCGTKFLQNQLSNDSSFEFAPPRPYVWKTDELQISENKARKGKQINQVRPLAQTPLMQTNPQHPVYQQPNHLAQHYRCPRCSSQLFPHYERKISTAGWIVFTVLLVTFFPLFWIGLLIKEDVRICPVCKLRIS